MKNSILYSKDLQILIIHSLNFQARKKICGLTPLNLKPTVLRLQRSSWVNNSGWKSTESPWSAATVHSRAQDLDLWWKGERTWPWPPGPQLGSSEMRARAEFHTASEASSSPTPPSLLVWMGLLEKAKIRKRSWVSVEKQVKTLWLNDLSIGCWNMPL